MRKARSSRQRNTGLLQDKASASVLWDAASEAYLAAWTYALPQYALRAGAGSGWLLLGYFPTGVLPTGGLSLGYVQFSQ